MTNAVTTLSVWAAGDEARTPNKKPGTLHQLAVTDAAQRRHGFLQALDRLSFTDPNRRELVRDVVVGMGAPWPFLGDIVDGRRGLDNLHARWGDDDEPVST